MDKSAQFVEKSIGSTGDYSQERQTSMDGVGVRYSADFKNSKTVSCILGRL